MNGFAKLVQGYLIDFWIRKRLKKYLVRLRDEWQVTNEPTYLESNFSFFPHKTMATVGMFDNVLFNNSFDLVRQFKNRSFLGVFFLPVTGSEKRAMQMSDLSILLTYIRMMFL